MRKSPKKSEKKEVEFKIVTSLSTGLTQTPDYLVENLIEKGDQVLLYGQPKVGKTFLAIQLACALATGKRFLKWEVKQKRKVLYVNFEMGERVFAERISKFLEQPGTDLGEEDLVRHFDSQIADSLTFTVSPRRMDLCAQQQELAKLIAEHSPDFIIFDTLAKLHSADERENNAISGVLTEVRDVCENKEGEAIAHLIVHHARKAAMNMTDSNYKITAAEIRGGSAIRGEADVILGLASSAGGKGGGAKMKLIMEARNVNLESELDLEYGENRILWPAAIQDRDVAKDKFLKYLKAHNPCDKNDVVGYLNKEIRVKEDTAIRWIADWMKTEGRIEEFRKEEDGRVKQMRWNEKKQ